MASGTVKFFDQKKGYGFIINDDDEKEIFVHFSNIQAEGFKKLEAGQKVAFEIGDGKNGPEAQKVTVIQD